MEKIIIKSSKRKEMIDITGVISRIIQKSGVKKGICFIFVPHTTCGITINENADPSVKQDILSFLCKIAPEDSRYTHTEGNSDAHIQSAITGQSLFVIIDEGNLQLGTWQGIFLCEFDGPRTRNVWIQIMDFRS
ncbi:MAG: secondary thiamine-phosphate synthase enzyme YjbQ [Candidatus Omnitrophica bacterium]|nr:secondary thiamine-phosphate synthase enzyme YjbQ [Candidatus Omnitrophota bacterium]MCM8817579.1 secondary thiamine-phosphate synthase enzyme YjbQ [Candidatus Omnitrophota bacterium]